MDRKYLQAIISILSACLILVLVVKTDRRYNHIEDTIKQKPPLVSFEKSETFSLLSLTDIKQSIAIGKFRSEAPVSPLMDMNWYMQVTENINNQEYEINYQKSVEAYQSPNRAQNLRITYFKDGFSVQPRAINGDAIAESILKNPFNHKSKNTRELENYNVSMKVSGFGKCRNYNNFLGKELIVNKNMVYIEDRRFRIEYENNKYGMRQNFIVKEKPEGEGLLEVILDVKSTLKVNVNSKSLIFANKSNEEIMKYSDLKIYDSEGKILDGYFKDYEGNKVLIAVNDANALYPIIIDPLTQSGFMEGNQKDASFGLSVSTAGDVNGDGYSDVIVGASVYDKGETDEGCVFLYYGSASGLSTTANWSIEGNKANANLGYSVAEAGDINKDGYSDVVIGAPGTGMMYNGSAYVYQGSASGLPLSANWTVNFSKYNSYFGGCVASAGDVNGDGYSDVIVGAPYYSNGQNYEGAAYVYQGSSTGLSTKSSWSAESNQASAYYGLSVSTAGDVNGDHFSDIIVSSYRFDNGQTDEGQVYVYNGTSSGLSTTANWVAESNQIEGFMGYCVSTAGDINKDGYSDVIIGAPGYSNGQTSEGAVFLFKGSASGLQQTASWTVEGDQDSAWLGYSVASGGDINGDGFSDIIVGCYRYDNGQTEEGRAYVYLSSGSSLSTSPNWMVESNQDNAQLGYSVSKAGDINKDGYDDIIIGAPGYSDGESSEGAAFLYTGASELPVELTTFKASVKTNNIELYWETATEINNLGFELQRSKNEETILSGTDQVGSYMWEVIAFVPGAGNSNSPKQYSFTDKGISNDKVFYRLRQIDNDGTFKYSDIVEVDIAKRQGFYLSQNSPNPCNPISEISYSIPECGHVTLKIYDMLGKEIVTLVDEVKESGQYKTIFNATNISSGLYIYSLETNGLRAVRKMVVLK